MEEDESRIEAVMNISFDKYDRKWIEEKDLLDVAKEWIKELSEHKYDSEVPRFYSTIWRGGDDCGSEANEVIDWIKHFFNME